MTQPAKQTITEAIKPPIKTHSKENPFIVKPMNILQGESNNLKTDKPVYHNLLSLIKGSPDYVQTDIPKIKQIIQNKYANPLNVAEHIVLNDQKWKQLFDSNRKVLFKVAGEIIRDETIENNYFSEVYFLKHNSYFDLNFYQIKKLILNTKNPFETIRHITKKSSLFQLVKLAATNYQAWNGVKEATHSMHLALEKINEFYEEYSKYKTPTEQINRTEIAIGDDINLAERIIKLFEEIRKNPNEYRKNEFIKTASERVLEKYNNIIRLSDVNDHC